MRVCRKVMRLLNAFDDGELHGKKRDFVSAHLEECDSCRFELEGIRRLRKLLEAAADVPDVDSKEWEQQWEAVRENLATPAPRKAPVFLPLWTFRRPAWTTVAAAVMLVVVGVFVGTGILPWSTEAMAEPGIIVTLVESDVENSSAMYYYCPTTDLTVISLVSEQEPDEGQ